MASPSKSSCTALTHLMVKRKMTGIGSFTFYLMTAHTTDIDEGLAADLGQRLRAVRMARGLQQAELADMAHVSRNTVISLERTGHATVSSMVSVSRALGLEGELRKLFDAFSAAAPQGSLTRQRVRRPSKPVQVAATA